LGIQLAVNHLIETVEGTLRSQAGTNSLASGIEMNCVPIKYEVDIKLLNILYKESRKQGKK
jgi:hypothetical protein